jgi:Mg-chelatase subunit ChlD
MMLAIGITLAVAAAGLLAVRTAPRPARLFAWASVIAFAAAAADPLVVSFVERPARTARAALGADASAPTQAMTAAASAGPRAHDLTLQWTMPLAASLGEGPLGAAAVLPAEPLPVDPGRVQLRAFGSGLAGRPLVLQLEAPGLRQRVAAVIEVRLGERVVHREALDVDGSAPAECSFVPGQAGQHAVACELAFEGHAVRWAGELSVAEPPKVLVLEPSGVAAAALQAQGMAVENADALPADWRQRPALVVGRPLSEADQQALVAAVLDGQGVFVLAPGFGGEGAPMRAVLPLRPRPAEQGDGPGGAGPGDTSPPDAPPPDTPPPADRPPTGETTRPSDVSREPIEVDKRSVAMVLVVDRSGSMGNTLANGYSKMSYAKTSALRTARALGPGDHVALVSFGDKGAGRVELPLVDATEIATVRTGIERLAHGPERTFLLSGLRLAKDLLAGSKAAVKHVVVITDGEFDLSEAVVLQEQARRMRTVDHSTVSVVSIVDQYTEQSFKREAERLTRAGGGHFLPVEDPRSVPVLVSAEVTRALSRVGREPRETGESDAPPAEVPRPADAPSPPADAPRTSSPVAAARVPVRHVAPSNLLAPIPAAEWPTLGAATPGTAPLDAQVLLVAGDAGWPLLAFGNRGLGRTGGFAADLFGEAGAQFRSADGFAARLTQWVQAVLPAEPVRMPQPLLRGAVVDPPAPTLRDAELLAALAGEPAGPQVPAAAPLPAIERDVESSAPRWALVLVLLLVALGAVERWAGGWSWRRGLADG